MTITNLTIKKLTTKELNDLDCFSTLGIGLYRGNLKAKVKLQNKYYSRTTTPDGVEVFELEGWEAHFIPLADEDKIPHWAFRVWDKELQCYKPIWNILMATNFIK